MKENTQQAYLKLFQQLIRLPLTNGGFTARCVIAQCLNAQYSGRAGFTLIEILVVVLIIGILGAIALPQYQRAVLKSRFAALMPIAKSMADSNEAYYLEHGEYADNAEDLPVQGRRNYPDGTELEFGTSTEYSYVLATNPGVENNMYVVYQKHSENFPGNIHCEALTEDNLANQVCMSFGGTPLEGSLGGEDYTAYLLAGNPTSGQFPKPCTTEPDVKQACSTCGFMTRQATCNTKTGEWEYDGDFDPDTCPTQPGPETGESCGTGFTGNLTRTATCSDDHSAWEYVGEWSRSACEEIPTCTGGQPADIQESCGTWDGTSYNNWKDGTKTGRHSCQSGQWVVTWDTSTCTRTYTTQRSNCTPTQEEPEKCDKLYFSVGGTSCEGKEVNSCSNNAFSKGQCQGKAANSCSNNIYNVGSAYGCVADAQGACSNSIFLAGSVCLPYASGSCVNNIYRNGGSCQGKNCPAGSFYGKYSDYDYRCNNGKGGYDKESCVAGSHFSETECFSGTGTIGTQYCQD